MRVRFQFSLRKKTYGKNKIFLLYWTPELEQVYSVHSDVVRRAQNRSSSLIALVISAIRPEEYINIGDENPPVRLDIEVSVMSALRHKLTACTFIFLLRHYTNPSLNVIIMIEKKMIIIMMIIPHNASNNIFQTISLFIVVSDARRYAAPGIFLCLYRTEYDSFRRTFWVFIQP